MGLSADEVEKGGCCSLWSPYVPYALFGSRSLHSTVVVAVQILFPQMLPKH
jgi:hypothetical protein